MQHEEPVYTFHHSFINPSSGKVTITRRVADLPNPLVENTREDPDVAVFSDAYEEIVHWKANLFDVPTCAVGRRFFKELTRWLQNFNAETKFRSIAIKTFMILPALLLQKPSAKAKE